MKRLFVKSTRSKGRVQEIFRHKITENDNYLRQKEKHKISILPFSQNKKIGFMSIWWSQGPLCCIFLLLPSMLMAQQQVITPASIRDSTAKTCKELSRFSIVIKCPPKPKNWHCPPPFKLERKNLKLDSVVILKKIEFDLNSSDLKSNTDRALQEDANFSKPIRYFCRNWRTH